MINSDSEEEARPSSRFVPTEKRRKMRANHSPDQQSSRAHRSSAQHSEHTTNLDASESEYSSMLEDEEASTTKKLTSSSSKLKIATMRADSTGQPLAAKKVRLDLRWLIDRVRTTTDGCLVRLGRALGGRGEGHTAQKACHRRWSAQDVEARVRRIRG